MLVGIGLPFDYINMHVLVKMFKLYPLAEILGPIFKHAMKTALLLHIILKNTHSLVILKLAPCCWLFACYLKGLIKNIQVKYG